MKKRTKILLGMAAALLATAALAQQSEVPLVKGFKGVHPRSGVTSFYVKVETDGGKVILARCWLADDKGYCRGTLQR